MISFDAMANSTVQASVSSFSWSHTNAGNLLLVGIAARDTGSTTDFLPSSVTYNGTNMTLSQRSVYTDGDTTDNLSAHVYYLNTPSIGAANVSVTFPGTVSHCCGFSASFNYASGVPLLHTYDGGYNDAADVADAETYLALKQECVCFSVCYNKTGSDMTAGVGQTLIGQLSPNSGGDRAAAIYQIASSGAIAMSLSNSAEDDWVMQSVAFGQLISKRLLVGV